MEGGGVGVVGEGGGGGLAVLSFLGELLVSDTNRCLFPNGLGDSGEALEPRWTLRDSGVYGAGRALGDSGAAEWRGEGRTGGWGDRGLSRSLGDRLRARGCGRCGRRWGRGRGRRRGAAVRFFLFAGLLVSDTNKCLPPSGLGDSGEGPEPRWTAGDSGVSRRVRILGDSGAAACRGEGRARGAGRSRCAEEPAGSPQGSRVRAVRKAAGSGSWKKAVPATRVSAPAAVQRGAVVRSMPPSTSMR